MISTTDRLLALALLVVTVAAAALFGTLVSGAFTPSTIGESNRLGADQQRSAERRPFDDHIAVLRSRLGVGPYTFVITPPFVVVGDASKSTVYGMASHTVRWAIDHLQKQFFPKLPEEIFDIWLFANEESYRRHAKKLFDDEPETPFGYFSESDRALVMNIATGGGTLVHELAHVLFAANFPDAPTWFEEGLASLYEQSIELDGNIRGLTNWRLAGLQKAIRNGQLRGLSDLCRMSRAEFYDSDTGYAQARYLLYYAQQSSKLEELFRVMQSGIERDPTGCTQTEKVLGSLAELDPEYQRFVMELTFSG